MFRDPQESRPIAFYNSILDVPICILAVDAACQALLFLHLDQFLGYQPEDFPDLAALLATISPNDLENFRTCLKSGEQVVQNIQMRNRAGQWEWVQCRPYQSQVRGGPLSLILVPVPGLKMMTRVLLESESKFRFVVRQAPVGIVIVDTEGRVAEFNRAMELITGYPGYEVVGKPIWEFQMIINQAQNLSHSSYEQAVRLALQQGRADWFGKTELLTIQHKDGPTRWINTSFFPIQAERGILIGMIAEDISERYQAEQRIREQSQHLKVLNSITRMALESSNLDEMLSALARQTTEVLNAAGCYITLWDHQKNLPYPAAGYGENLEQFLGSHVQPGQPTLTAAVLAAGRAIFVEDYLHSAYVASTEDENRPTYSIFCLPLKMADQKLGALMVDFWQIPAGFEHEKVSQWEEVASQLSLAIYKALLLEQERQRRQEAEGLQQAIAATASNVNLEQVLVNIQVGIERVVPFDLASIVLWVDDKNFQLVALQPRDEVLIPYIGKTYPLETSVLSQWKEDEEYLIVEDVQQRSWTGNLYIQHYPDMHAFMALHLSARGKSIGFITLGSRRPGFYTVEHARRLRPFADQAAVAIENARLFEQVRYGRERLQHLSHRLVEVQEIERRRLALELHEEVGQELTAMNYFLEMSRMVEGNAQREILADAQNQVQLLMQRVREMSLNLHPNVLDDLGLQPGLEWFVKRYQAQTQIEVQVQFECLNRRFDLDVETAVFRVVQEALTNIARHAQTRQVSVAVRCQGPSLLVDVIDQGIGFDLKIIKDHSRAFGISGMIERANLVGGQFEIISAPGEGTTIRAVFPIDQPIERRQNPR